MYTFANHDHLDYLVQMAIYGFRSCEADQWGFREEMHTIQTNLIPTSESYLWSRYGYFQEGLLFPGGWIINSLKGKEAIY